MMMAVCRISAIPAHRFLFSLARNLCGSFVFQSGLVNWHFDAILLKMEKIRREMTAITNYFANFVENIGFSVKQTL